MTMQGSRLWSFLQTSLLLSGVFSADVKPQDLFCLTKTWTARGCRSSRSLSFTCGLSLEALLSLNHHSPTHHRNTVTHRLCFSLIYCSSTTCVLPHIPTRRVTIKESRTRRWHDGVCRWRERRSHLGLYSPVSESRIHFRWRMRLLMQ